MEQVAWSMEYFTVAHEYGHHVLNHRSVDADPVEQEYEADRFALRVCDALLYEPFSTHNPYLSTGAGASLMLKALSVLRSMRSEPSNAAVLATHPLTEVRIERIMNRHLLQPDRLKMDHDFNGTVLRIMNAVAELLKDYLDFSVKSSITANDTI